MHGKKLIMGDTPAEMRDHDAPVRVARGRCLINGLGLGVVLQACLQKSEVEHVTVVEVSQDVVDLVAPHYFEMFGAQRLEVICADAYEFKPSKGIRYGMVWNDIWIDITTDNYEGMKKLHRKYGRSSDWVGSWMRHEIKTQFLREQREAKMWGR
jgi:predicted membrane-bound spermidine synthase